MDGGSVSNREVHGALIQYDAERRRLWVRGRRVHHGLTGVVFAAAGIAMMAHDWRDRSRWFRLGD